jgi:hypothetical protein
MLVPSANKPKQGIDGVRVIAVDRVDERFDLARATALLHRRAHGDGVRPVALRDIADRLHLRLDDGSVVYRWFESTRAFQRRYTGSSRRGMRR